MRLIIMMLMMLLMMSQISVASAEKKIIINLASRLLALYDGNNRIEMFPLGVGKVSTPTPTGYYKILTKEVNPTWIDPSNPEYEVPSGSSNPLGYRWMRIYGNYGIHGTNKPDSIGHYVSNGCIRMREPDVEKLFDEVEINTPVEITYNRVVVEKATDDRIVYYVYPDGYGWQAIDVKYVNSWIAPWGISAFVEDKEISEAIVRSDGEPNYIGRVYSIEFDDKVIPSTEQNQRHFDSKAVERGGITYLPVVPIAMAMEMKLEWHRKNTTLTTKYGEVSGIEKKGQLYINEDDAGILFNVNVWREGEVYKLKRLTEEEKNFDVTKIDSEEKNEVKPEDKLEDKQNNKLENKIEVKPEDESKDESKVKSEDKSKNKSKDKSKELEDNQPEAEVI